MLDALFDPWAPHPVVNKHICFGGGGGDTYNAQLPQVPDYGKFIQQMTNIGGFSINDAGTGAVNKLFDWAQSMGVNLSSIANTVSTAAGAAATTGQDWANKLQQQWSDLSAPLYQAQQRDVLQMQQDLPQYQEEMAGKGAADAVAAVDQQKASAIRDMEGRGLAPNAAATGALDTMAGTARAATGVAQAELARTAARNESRTATATALGQEGTIANVGATQGALATQNRTQQTTAPNQAAATTAALYQPSQGFYSSAYPYYASWGATMGQGFNELSANYNSGLQAFKANQESSAYSPLSTILGVGAGIAGSFLGGPAGGAIGSGIGKMIGNIGSSGGSTALGSGSLYAHGGAVNTVPPSASPSGGRRTDDVHAALSVGEFVIPKRTVDWYGDKFFHGLINRADKAQGQPPQPIGPESKPMDSAIMTQPPMFRSEGASA